jgi:hypothetical protein
VSAANDPPNVTAHTDHTAPRPPVSQAAPRSKAAPTGQSGCAAKQSSAKRVTRMGEARQS